MSEAFPRLELAWLKTMFDLLDEVDRLRAELRQAMKLAEAKGKSANKKTENIEVKDS